MLVFLFFVVPIVVSAFIGLFSGATWQSCVLCLMLGIGFSIPLERAIKMRTIHALQDGWTTFSDTPLRFIVNFIIVLAGYIMGLLAPWLLNEMGAYFNI